MKMHNRILAALLCALMLIGVLPSGQFAVKTSAAQNSGFSISDVSVDGKTATAVITNDEACRLVVALYDPGTGKMLASGITSVAKNAGTAQVSFAVSSMPQYFVIKAFALDGNMGALCAKFESRLYTKELENFRKVTFFVYTPENGERVAVAGASVTSPDGYCDNAGGGEVDNRTAKTGESGDAVLYFAPGRHTITAGAPGYFQTTAEFTVEQSGQTVDVRLLKNASSDTGEAPSSSDGTGCDDGWIDRKHFNFGSYPQTDVTASMGSVLDSQEANWKSYGFYSGTGKSTDGNMTAGDYMLYCDVTYGEEKYRGVTFSTYRPSVTGYKTMSTPDYSHQNDNGYTCGNVYWFKYEPVEWRVINSQTGLVISETIIDSIPYSNYVKKGNDGNYYNDKGACITDWETSSLKAWLNDDFYRTAFTAEEQNEIIAGENGSIFVLTEQEATNPVYFTSAFPRGADGSDYAECLGLNTKNMACPEWRLRSPGISSLYTCAVLNDGGLDEQCSAGLTGTGVRPSFKINMTSLGTQPSRARQATVGSGVFDYSFSGCIPGNEYILLNVTGYGNGFTLSTDNLEYIDQITAGTDGKVSGSFNPRKTYPGSTTLLTGDFGNGVETKKLTVTEETTVTPDPVIPDLKIVNYKSTLQADYKSKLIFHTNIEAPDGYWIVWSTGDVGSTCTIDCAENGEYKIKADLVRISDNKIVKSTPTETVSVNTGLFAKIIAFFRQIFKILPVYENNIKQ